MDRTRECVTSVSTEPTVRESTGALPLELAAQVDSRAVITMARELGWQVLVNVMPGVTLLRGPNGAEALVPTETGFADAPVRLREAVELLARFQSRPTMELATELMRAKDG